MSSGRGDRQDGRQEPFPDQPDCGPWASEDALPRLLRSGLRRIDSYQWKQYRENCRTKHFIERVRGYRRRKDAARGYLFRGCLVCRYPRTRRS